MMKVLIEDMLVNDIRNNCHFLILVAAVVLKRILYARASC